MTRPSDDPAALLLRLQLPAPLPGARTPRARLIAHWFGLRMPRPSAAVWESDQLAPITPAAGQILLITGPSGAGKSSLLRAIRARLVGQVIIDLNQIALPERPLVDCFGSLALEQVLCLLNRVGLSEAWTYLRTPGELSDGQRWRLRLALALTQAQAGPERSAGPDPRPNPSDRSAHPTLLCDEFAALLDRVTAAVVAHALRRLVDSHQNLCALVATSHDDLLEALAPDVHAHCDFGTVTVMTTFTSTASRSRSPPG